MGIEIFSKNDCKYCEYAEDICKKMNLDYTKTVVDKTQLQEKCGPSALVYPQIVVNGKHIGDYFAFQEYIDETEPMLLPIMSRFTVFPIEHENLWALYKKAQMSNWTAEEIDVTSDMEDWGKLSENERHFVKYILAFFYSFTQCLNIIFICSICNRRF